MTKSELIEKLSDHSQHGRLIRIPGGRQHMRCFRAEPFVDFDRAPQTFEQTTAAGDVDNLVAFAMDSEGRCRDGFEAGGEMAQQPVDLVDAGQGPARVVV